MPRRFKIAVLCLSAVLGAGVHASAVADDGAFYRMALNEAAADAAIRGKVEAALAGDKPLQGADILVDTKGGVVLLSGQADSTAQRSRAGRLAANIPGVRKVMNEIFVERTPGGSIH